HSSTRSLIQLAKFCQRRSNNGDQQIKVISYRNDSTSLHFPKDKYNSKNSTLC
ncbi:hypothetical protein M5D96_006243, partial [Drosophila gunungcola]